MAADGTIIIDTKVDTSGIERGESQIKKSLHSIGNTAKKIGGIIAAAFAIKKVAEFGKECLELGSDLQEVQNVVDSVFTTMSDKVDEFAKNAAMTAGLSETMAKKYTGTFGAMAKSFGFTEQSALDMSTSLAQLSGDVASFYNITQDEAYTKLKSVFTGETESLKELGVVMTQTALDEYAMANGFGKTTSAMTEQEKVSLRYKFVMSQLSTASGDFIRTSNGWANQVRIMKLQIESLKATIGQGLINIFTPVIKMINLLLAKLATVANAFKSFTELITGNKSSGQTGTKDAGISNGLEGTANVYESATEGADNFSESTDNATGAIKDNTDALKKQEKAVKGSIAAFDELNVISNQNEDLDVKTQNTPVSAGKADIGQIDYGKLADTKDAADKINSNLSGIVSKIKELAGILKSGFFKGLGEYKPILNEMSSDFSNITKHLKDIFTDEDIRKSVNNLAETIAESIGKISGSVAKIGLTVGAALIGGVESYLSKNADRIKKFIIKDMDVSSEIYKIFSDIFVVIADIFSVFSGQTMQDIIGGLLQIFSDTFMAIQTIGKQFIRDILNIILIPLQENSELLKLTIENTLKFIESIVTTVAGTVRSILEGIIKLYDTHLKPFFDSIALGISSILTTLLTAYNEHIVPVLDGLALKFNELMNGPFGDMVESVIRFVGKLIDLLKNLWESILVPLINWFIKNVVPQIARGLDETGRVFLSLLETVSKVVGDLFDALSGVIDFIEGVFTGDWEKAWEGIKEIFKGVFDALVEIAKVPINGVIGLINGMLRGIVSGVNGAIGAINSIKVEIPDWVLGIGGKTMGFNIPEVRAPQIPYLAQGTVIPPRAREFAAVLGDNNRETEIVSPLSTIKQALVEAMKDTSGETKAPGYIILNIDGNEFIRWMQDKDGQYRARNGYGIFEG